MVNTQQLKCFVAVADKLNFTKAAESLFLTTPALSHHIKMLEAEMETALFVRTSKMVKLTEAGKLFYGDAIDILEKIKLSHKKILTSVSKKACFFHIGCTAYAELEGLNSALSGIRLKFSNVYPLIHVLDYFKLKMLFGNKQLDIMFVTKDMISDIECNFQKIKDIYCYAIMPSSHRLSAKDILTFKDLDNECLLIINPKFIPFNKNSVFQKNFYWLSQKNFHLICDNYLTSITLAKNGYGISIVPENAFSINEVERENMSARPIKVSLQEYGIAYQKEINELYVKFFLKFF